MVRRAIYALAGLVVITFVIFLVEPALLPFYPTSRQVFRMANSGQLVGKTVRRAERLIDAKCHPNVGDPSHMQAVVRNGLIGATFVNITVRNGVIIESAAVDD